MEFFECWAHSIFPWFFCLFADLAHRLRCRPSQYPNNRLLHRPALSIHLVFKKVRQFSILTNSASATLWKVASEPTVLVDSFRCMICTDHRGNLFLTRKPRFQKPTFFSDLFLLFFCRGGFQLLISCVCVCVCVCVCFVLHFWRSLVQIMVEVGGGQPHLTLRKLR